MDTTSVWRRIGLAVFFVSYGLSCFGSLYGMAVVARQKAGFRAGRFERMTNGMFAVAIALMGTGAVMTEGWTGLLVAAVLWICVTVLSGCAAGL